MTGCHPALFLLQCGRVILSRCCCSGTIAIRRCAYRKEEQESDIRPQFLSLLYYLSSFKILPPHGENPPGVGWNLKKKQWHPNHLKSKVILNSRNRKLTPREMHTELRESIGEQCYGSCLTGAYTRWPEQSSGMRQYKEGACKPDWPLAVRQWESAARKLRTRESNDTKNHAT